MTLEQLCKELGVNRLDLDAPAQSPTDGPVDLLIYEARR